ncbi:MAG: hypothetical protein IMZ55_08020 [Acidobacteria bacterium]|nr:hypothetical protein [Acidobacteriota bacterium]
MKTFTDSQGRTWNVVVNVSAIKRVRDLLGVDLLDVANGELLSRLADDPCLLVDVLFALCKPEADAKGVSDEDFGRGMVGGVLDEASAALMKELLDFFPSAQRARALGRMARKITEQGAAVAEAAAAIQSMPGASSGNSPASAASTPPA